MKTGIALFVYNRPEHTKHVLEGLKKNNIKKLYIFADGLKIEEHRKRFEELRNLIHSIDWCETEIVESDSNKGLADSIVYGVGYVLERHERIIVLEDDCVPASDFVAFMEKCFDKYESNEKVMCVSGYSYPIDIPKDYKYDIYFSYRGCSWGWGTWKRSWNKFNRDYGVLKRIYKSEKGKKNLELAGNDLVDMLKFQLEGKVDSWAVFFALNIVENEGICINPIKSLIRNEGFDGSGTNCGETNQYDVELNCIDISKIKLPENIIHEDIIEKKLKKLWNTVKIEDILKQYYSMYDKWVKNLQNGILLYEYFINKGIEKVYIYGNGTIGKTLCDELIRGGIIISNFIDARSCSEEYKGISAIDVYKLIQIDPKSVIIITPIWDFENIYDDLRKSGFNGAIISLESIIDTLSCKIKQI